MNLSSPPLLSPILPSRPYSRTNSLLLVRPHQATRSSRICDEDLRFFCQNIGALTLTVPPVYQSDGSNFSNRFAVSTSDLTVFHLYSILSAYRIHTIALEQRGKSSPHNAKRGWRLQVYRPAITYFDISHEKSTRLMAVIKSKRRVDCILCLYVLWQ